MCQSQNRGGRAGLHHQGRANQQTPSIVIANALQPLDRAQSEIQLGSILDKPHRPINVFSTLPGALPVRQAQGVMRDIVFAKQAVGRFLDRRTIASAREG
jgi:hypothetical protein